MFIGWQIEMNNIDEYRQMRELFDEFLKLKSIDLYNEIFFPCYVIIDFQSWCFTDMRNKVSKHNQFTFTCTWNDFVDAYYKWYLTPIK